MDPTQSHDTAPDDDWPQHIDAFFDACARAFQDAARAMSEFVTALGTDPAGER